MSPLAPVPVGISAAIAAHMQAFTVQRTGAGRAEIDRFTADETQDDCRARFLVHVTASLRSEITTAGNTFAPSWVCHRVAGWTPERLNR